MAKTEGFTYLTDAQYLGTTQPGPSTYEIQTSQVLRNQPAFKISDLNKVKAKTKIFKDKGPDMGTYLEKSEQRNLLLRKSASAFIGNPKSTSAEFYKPEKISVYHLLAR